MSEEKKTALVTGASHGIGAALCAQLIEEGWKVYGIGRCFTQPASVSFVPIVLDLLDTGQLLQQIKQLPREDLSLLVNNAGCAYYGMHEELAPERIQEMVRLDLEVPMVLCQQLIRPLRVNHGMILNVASACALTPSPHGAAYAGVKAGLLHFSDSLFEENRKYGLRVCTVLPDLTRTDLYRHADFEPSRQEGEALSAEQAAQAMMMVIKAPASTVLKTLEIQPLRSRIQKKRPL